MRSRVVAARWTMAPATLAVLVLCPLAGCEKPDPWGRVALKGNVTTTEIGNPDEVNGTLTIVPAPGNRGPSAVTAIKAGKYEFTAETGPVPGSCIAVVSLLEPQPYDPKAEPGVRPVRAKPMPGPPGTKARSWYLPKKEQKIEVPGEKVAQLDLNL